MKRYVYHYNERDCSPIILKKQKMLERNSKKYILVCENLNRIQEQADSRVKKYL